MKKIFVLAFIAIITLSFDCTTASAKDIPTGMRMEIAEAGEDDNECTLFTYKDEDGNFGYYLGLGRVFRILDVLFDGELNSSFDHVDEVCLCLGATPDVALASLDTLLSMFDKDVNTVVELPARMSTGADRLGVAAKVPCIVKKKFIGGKYLQFHFVSGKHTAEADLSKSTVKFLKKGLELDMKRR